jgi:hypothetical protein
MASIHGGLFHAAPTHVTATARSTAGPLSLAQVTGAGPGGSGHETTSGPPGDPRFAGSPAGSEQVLATQTQAGGTTTLTLHDGSVINFIGTPHFDVIIH